MKRLSVRWVDLDASEHRLETDSDSEALEAVKNAVWSSIRLNVPIGIAAIEQNLYGEFPPASSSKTD